MRAWIFSLSLAFAPFAAARPFPLYNLSILYPMPKDRLADTPGLADRSCARAFLELALFEELPPLLPSAASAPKRFEELRLVGVRFDSKQSEARLVFQPMVLLPRNHPRGQVFVADDAALHLFYRMERAQILAIQSRLASAFPGLPLNQLGLHPQLGTPTERARLQSVLCEIARLPLLKVTFMTVRGNRTQWKFGGFKVDTDVRGARRRGADVAIANADEIFTDPNDSNMSVIEVTRLGRNLLAALEPEIRRGDHLGQVFDSRANHLPAVRAREILRRIDRIENPRLNSPDTVDCVSCHATESARRVLVAQHPTLPTSPDFYPLPAGYGLDASVPAEVLANPLNFRAFGFFDFVPSVSQRTLFDTIEMQRDLDGAPERLRPRPVPRPRREI